ncbi:MAG: acetyl-CoA decarbonylase/synthase complex subunit gamma [Elusimicrobia bacterium HGW-Elusimicrobia-1]|jgi:acetyl-CoA decarbonylase/synthase complex subunit gamma|nr:MAG: acetyl-CoA decarbonylase/synthase complex subunit gamma [Elusimicrobia bacterium HGW-Elusimicrobia-1]
MTGLEIYKLLPKTNCKKCGYPTCLAFAMALAAKKASLEKCPDVTEAARLALAASAEPPIKTVEIKDAAGSVKLGGETVLFRHEKTFWNPCAIAVRVSDADPAADGLEAIDAATRLKFERVGEQVRTEFVFIENTKSDDSDFRHLSDAAFQSGMLVALCSKSAAALEAVCSAHSDRKFIIAAPLAADCREHLKLAAASGLPLAVGCNSLDECLEVSAKASSVNFANFLFLLKLSSPSETLDMLVQLRRLSLKKNNRALGRPVIAVTSDSADAVSEAVEAAQYVEKYASMVVVKTTEPAAHLALVSLRQNIYTDPQKPVSVEAKLYKIGAATLSSPLLITTNFSLTYYSVVPEIEASKVPCHLLVVDTEGMSVLTAWSADKFSPEIIAEAMKKTGVTETVSHRKVVVPGYVAVISGKLSDLTGFEAVVGPKEASALPRFLKEFKL